MYFQVCLMLLAESVVCLFVFIVWWSEAVRVGKDDDSSVGGAADSNNIASLTAWLCYISRFGNIIIIMDTIVLWLLRAVRQ